MKKKLIKYYVYLFIAVALPQCKEPDPLIKLKTVSRTTTQADIKAKVIDRKTAKKKWKEDRKTKMFTDRGIREYHKKLQTKNTLKSMKAMRKKSDKIKGNSW